MYLQFTLHCGGNDGEMYSQNEKIYFQKICESRKFDDKNLLSEILQILILL